MKILFITGHRKSGTTLLNSLLDDVDGMCVYPHDLTLLYAYHPYFNNKKYSYSFKKKRINKIINYNFKEFIKIHPKKKKNIKIFINEFLNNLNKKNIDNIEEITKLLINKYLNFYIKEKKIKEDKVQYFVFKETSSTYLFNKINNWFDNVKFIQIIRDPRDNFSALYSGLNKKYIKNGESHFYLLCSTLFRLTFDFNFLEYNKKFYKKNKFHQIKFENLVNSKIATLKKLSNFLKFKFDKKMLIPSIFGKVYKGNNLQNKKFSSISNKNVNNWKKRISSSDVNILNFFMNNLFKKNYKFDELNQSQLNDISKFYKQVNQYLFFDKFN